ncbi:hypothetical protein TBCH5v1_2086 [Thermococcus barophilus]|uniref:KaiC-like domain-containing protein n=2 Tax=Thermococcus barophilus TaxID=55802 RepID=A0A0S1XDV7_THEBA|nr:hypothetical protein TBCH5v1_2086 [Thermococcus barophilus]
MNLMETVQEINIRDVLKFFVPRSSGIVFYDSRVHPGLILFRFLKALLSGGFSVLLLDYFDTLSLMKYQAEILDSEIPEELKVVKIGGEIEVGEILKRMSPSRTYQIDLRKVCETINSVVASEEKGVFVIPVGIEKYLALLELHERIRAALFLTKCVTLSHENMRKVWFVNKEVWHELRPFVPGFVEESMLFIAEIIGQKRVRIKKTIYPELLGVDVVFDL